MYMYKEDDRYAIKPNQTKPNLYGQVPFGHTFHTSDVFCSSLSLSEEFVFMTFKGLQECEDILFYSFESVSNFNFFRYDGFIESLNVSVCLYFFTILSNDYPFIVRDILLSQDWFYFLFY